MESLVFIDERKTPRKENGMSNVNMYERRHALFSLPLIIPVNSLYSHKLYEHKNRTFAIVKCQKMTSASEVIAWLQNETEKDWLIPTVTVAGEKWKINPKPTLEGWAWLFLMS